MASMLFTKKVIAITGATRGIGRVTALYLAQRGASLSISDIGEESLNELSQEIKSKFPDKTVNELGALHGAVNLAGVLHNSTLNFVDIQDEDWNRVISIKLSGTMYSMRSEIAVMEKGGSIVNASSVAGLMAGPGVVAYAASKAAVISLTKSVAKEIGVREIRVNAICPSGIDTPMFRQLFDQEYTNKIVLAPHAIKRHGKVEEAAALIAFLLGDDSKHITRETIRIDGGICA
ncbi:hypothetical protein CEP53_005697 [Fusarium sp. AF-6]|nr:hypothetical protein CEP53_005697 [Fusarium sp. AF-6]